MFLEENLSINFIYMFILTSNFHLLEKHFFHEMDLKENLFYIRIYCNSNLHVFLHVITYGCAGFLAIYS